jgi:O-antigen/teichoic acid export membrane protein
VSTTFSPLMAGLHARGDRTGLSRVLAVSSWLAFAPAALTLLGAAVLGRFLLATFFPAAYGEAFIPLLLVVAATTVNGGFGLSSTMFLMTGHQRIVRIYSGLQLIAVTIAGGLLALVWGVVGIALAILVGAIIIDVGLSSRVRPLLDVGGPLKPSGLADLLRSLRRGKWHLATETGR